MALSVLMTNFSTEQLIGLNGDAFRNGATAIAWEAFGALGLVVFAWIFLPRYYAAGVTTIPQYVEQRCGRPVRRLMSLLMLLSLVAMAVLTLPVIAHHHSGFFVLMKRLNATLEPLFFTRAFGGYPSPTFFA